MHIFKNILMTYLTLFSNYLGIDSNVITYAKE